MIFRIKLQTLNLIEFENALELFVQESKYNHPVLDTNCCISWSESKNAKLWYDIYDKDRHNRIYYEKHSHYSNYITYLDAKILDT